MLIQYSRLYHAKTFGCLLGGPGLSVTPGAYDVTDRSGGITVTDRVFVDVESVTINLSQLGPSILMLVSFSRHLMDVEVVMPCEWTHSAAGTRSRETIMG